MFHDFALGKSNGREDRSWLMILAGSGIPRFDRQCFGIDMQERETGQQERSESRKT